MCCFSPAAFPHFWRMVLLDIVFLVNSFFFLQHFEYIILLPSWLARFWWESAENLIQALWYMMSHFFPAVFKILSLTFDTLIITCLGVGLWFNLIGVECHKIVCPFLSSNLGGFGSLFFQISFLPFSLFSLDFHNAFMAHLMISHSPLGSLQFSSLCFLFDPVSMISNDLPSSSLTVFFCLSSRLLNPSSEFFNSVITLFSSRICLIISNSFF